MRAVANEADLAITHAGLGTVADFLLAGKPLVLLPVHLDQLLLAEKLASQQLAWTVNPYDLPQVLSVIEMALGEYENQQAVRDIANNYAIYDSAKTLKQLVARIEVLVD